MGTYRCKKVFGLIEMRKRRVLTFTCAHERSQTALIHSTALYQRITITVIIIRIIIIITIIVIIIIVITIVVTHGPIRDGTPMSAV